MRSILDLATVDWDHLAEMAAGVVPGYRIEYHPGDLPEQMLERYAEAKQVAPAGPRRGPGPAAQLLRRRSGCGRA